ncbi:hypothetical protein GCM10025867_18940 [Frondihabitans sucicola]|uniref:ABC transporter domain-containing protein n=1 Tax=Frondihabitans sucicola TaxID=1268041 RepID=A0ABN6Y0Y8_9MICO|nr:ABC transporter ATP-binding protein/permease [Frondihabitans sucicola]BDZ49653.1 hypothetical protein GCM10025867_18940 [Frondihabitans sucicola]
MPTLILKRIRRSFVPTEEPVLKGVDLTLPQGSFVVIEGPSGEGKSTLLNVIGLLDSPDSGSYSIDDREVTELAATELTALRSDTFGFIFQSFHLLDRRPVTDSVELGLLYRGVPSRERRRLAVVALDKVGLRDRGGQRSSTLSGGERQRVAIARALASDTPVVVADEPTGNLDSANSRRVVECLADLNRAGRTVILVTHSPEVAAVTEARVTLRNGTQVDETRSRAPGAEIPLSNVDVVTPPVGAPPGRASRLRFLDLLRDSVSSVRSRPGRSVALILAVAVGVALAVSTLGLSESARSQVTDTFDAHANRYVTASWAGGTLSSAAPRNNITSRLRGLAGVESAGVLIENGGTYVRAAPARPSLQVPEFHGTPSALAVAGTTIAWATGHHGKLGAGQALIGRSLAKQLALSSVDTRPVVTISGQDRTVVGIVSSSPRLAELVGAVVVPIHGTRMFDEESAQVHALLVTTAGAAQQVARQVAVAIDPYLPDGIHVDAPPDPSSLRADIESDVQITLWAFTVLALLGSVAGLANSMVLSVIERRHEFGLRRAVGARPIHISGLVMVESGVMGVVGGVIGLGLGLAAVIGVTIARQWIPVFDLRLAPVAIGGGILVGAAGGLLAAARASRILPHDALRH